MEKSFPAASTEDACLELGESQWPSCERRAFKAKQNCNHMGVLGNQSRKALVLNNYGLRALKPVLKVSLTIGT